VTKAAGRDEGHQLDDGFGGDRQHQPVLMFGGIALAGSEQHRECRHRQRGDQCNVPMIGISRSLSSLRIVSATMPRHSELERRCSRTDDDGGIRGAVRNRQSDATEHQHGLMLASPPIHRQAGGFIAAGAFVTFWMFSPHELVERAMKTPEAVRAIDYVPSLGNFLTMVLLFVLRDHAAAAPSSRQRGREFQRRTRSAGARWLCSAVFGRHQPVRDPDRDRGFS